MARRAQFGRRPRVQQSITGTLVSIAREMQAREDQNIMDAWRNGGEVHGRKVTDDMVLNYWTRRRKTLDKADPSYDQIDNQISQLEYAVAQSKADLAHVQGKMSDTQFAQFYLKWSKKVPKNSEFWRVLQKDAAALMAQAKAKRATGNSAAEAQRIKTENYNKYVDGVSKRDIAFANALRDAVHKMSDQTGLTIDGNGDKLLQLVTEDIKLHPKEYGTLLDAAKARPNWDGNISRNLYSDEMERAQHGATQIAARSKKDGFVSNWQSNNKAAEVYADEGQNVAGWSVGKSYSIREQAFIKAVQSGDIVTQNKAAQEFGAWIKQQSENPKLDEATRQLLGVDAARLLGETDGVDIAAPGYGGGVLKHGDTINQIAPMVAKNLELVTQKDANPGMFVFAHIDPKTGAYDATGEGPIGIVARTTVPPDAVYLPQASSSGAPLTVASSPQTVYAKDPNNPTAPPVAVGVVVTQKMGDQVIEHYRIRAEDGSYRWMSRDSATAAGVTESKDSDGNRYWTPPPRVLTPEQVLAGAAAVDKSSGNKTTLAALVKKQLDAGVAPNQIDLSQEVPREGGGNDTYKVSGGSVTGTYTINPEDPNAVKTVTNFTVLNDPTDKSGFDPFGVIDASFRKADAADLPMGLVFNSAAAKSLNDIAKGMSGDQARAILHDPEFQFAFINEEANQLHTTPDDPRIAADFARAQSGANLANGLPLQREHYGRSAAMKIGLDLPGLRKTDAQGQPAIVFGNQTLTIPTAPTINPSGDAADRRAAAIQAQQVMPTQFNAAQLTLAANPLGFAPNAMTPPSTMTTPTANKPPTSTPTPTPTSAPTPTATPTPTVTPIPTITPTPTVKPPTTGTIGYTTPAADRK